MTRTYRQCYRHKRLIRPLRGLWDTARWLRDYYARYYGLCRRIRDRTLSRKADESMSLFEVLV